MSSYSQTKTYDVDIPPADTPSEISFSPNYDLFCVSSWDGAAYFYSYQNSYNLKTRIQTQTPLLTCLFQNENCLTGSTNGTLSIIDLNTGNTQSVKIHESGISKMKKYQNFYITSSWDKTIKVFDSNTNQIVKTIEQNERIYNLDILGDKLVITTARNEIIEYDIRSMQQKMHETRLTWHLKSMCLMDDGIIVGGIDGRAEFIGNGNKFIFRSHRQVSELYTVNVLGRLNSNTFYSGGSDGNAFFFDKNSRVKLYTGNIKVPVTCVGVNKNYCVIGGGYDWSRGYEQVNDKNVVRIVDLNTTNVKL